MPENHGKHIMQEIESSRPSNQPIGMGRLCAFRDFQTFLFVVADNPVVSLDTLNLAKAFLSFGCFLSFRKSHQGLKATPQ